MANLMTRLFGSLVTTQAAEHAAERSAMPAGVRPPARAGGQHVTPRRAATLPAVYRALDILCTASSQLSLDAYRGADQLSPAPALIRRPSLRLDRADFVELSVMSLATAGDLFWRLHTGPSGTAGTATVLDIEILNPWSVTVGTDRDGRTVYHHDGDELAPFDPVSRYGQIRHVSRMKLPGASRGLGPIQAAQVELAGALDVRDYAGNWFQDTGQPTGILSSDQELTAADAQLARNAWNGLDEDGRPLDQAANPSGIKVIGKGMDYQALFLKPADAQWLESRQFTTTEVARMFGIPASLMLAAVEGNSQTYSNVEQDWIAFTRYTLMGYTGKIERALSDMLPHGQSARFNLEALQRADTKTRYEGHALALGRWMTADEIRAVEKLPELTDAQRAELAAATPAPPAAQEIDA